MPVLIDGNNLLHAAVACPADDGVTDRPMLCDALGAWAERCREDVHIVFDGPAPPRNRARPVAHRGIKVTYSGAGVSADAVLEGILGADFAARRLVVVSSDRAVMRAARRRRARVLRSADFWARVRRDLARPARHRTEPEEKEAGLGPDAARSWLREFGLDEPSGI